MASISDVTDSDNSSIEDFDDNDDDLEEDEDLEGQQVHHADHVQTAGAGKDDSPRRGLSLGKSWKRWLLGFLTILSLTLLISGIAVSVRKNKKEDSAAAVFTPTGRVQQVEEFLFSNQISTLPVLRKIGSPEQLAMAFVADGDMLQMPLTPVTYKRFVERFILALLYYHFNGPQWTNQLKFLSGLDHCDWNEEFHTSADSYVRQGITCNDDGYVMELNLAWNNLRGTHMPNEIGFMGELEVFHLYYNEIGGYFPESFRSMRKLKSIGLMKTGLIGTLPTWIGEMTQLTSLGLGDNHMLGSIPVSIESLINLRILGLDGNAGMAGNIEVLKNLSSLEALYLEKNSLTGNLHNAHWPNLVELDVSDNLLDESFPVDFFNHPKLRVLDIHGNLMMGTIPFDIFENANLEYLAAYNSGFSGTIPDRLGFLTNLKHVDISFNALTGTIPDTMTRLTNLHYLATSGNNFDAQPLLDWSRMTNLMDFSMKNNSLTGSIPDWIGELTNLQLLDLDANSLTGRIPSWIGLMQNLNYLLLNRNQLTGTIPTQIQNLHHLQVLLLDSNSISGNANAICEQKQMNPSRFVADCYPSSNGDAPEVECRCCSQCCNDDDPSCNDYEWTSNLDLIWEDGYTRKGYSFHLVDAPAAYSKKDSN